MPTFVPALQAIKLMKAFLKCCLLLALVIGGKIAKQSPPAAVAAQSIHSSNQNEVVLVHQVLTSEPVLATPSFDFEQPRKRDTAEASAF